MLTGITRSLMENVSAWFAAGSPEKMSVGCTDAEGPRMIVRGE